MNQTEDASEIFHDALETQTIADNDQVSIETISQTLEKAKQVRHKLQAKNDEKYDKVAKLLEEIVNKLDDEICKNIIIEETQTSILTNEQCLIVEKNVDLRPSSKREKLTLETGMNFDRNVTIK